MSDIGYRAFCEARKGSPLAEGEFEAIYSRVEAAWIDKVESAVREQIARDIEERMDHDDAQRGGDAFSEGLWSGLNEARHIARGGRS